MKVFLKWSGYFLSLAAIFIIGSEIFLWFIHPPQNKYYVFPPYTQKTYQAQPDIVSGVTGTNRFTINSQGLRAREQTSQDEPRLLLLGGSTAECIVLDDEEAWPRLVEKQLQQKHSHLWLGNAGRSGVTSYENVLHLRHIPSQIGRIDNIIVLIGANDATMPMADRPWEFDENDRYERAFFTIVQRDRTFPKNAALYSLWKEWERLLRFRKAGIVQGEGYFEWVANSRKARYADKPHIEHIPKLEPYLQQYEHNLRSMIQLAQKAGAKLTFITQPLFFRAGLTDEEERTLGGYGITSFMADTTKPGNQWYSAKAIGEINEHYHAITRRVAEEHGLTCIDAAKHFPVDIETFYDGIHFTENGSRKFADWLTKEITNLNLLP